MAGTSNSNLVAQAQSSTGSSAAGTPATPVNDISQIPSEAPMYLSGDYSTNQASAMTQPGNRYLRQEEGNNVDQVKNTTVEYWLNQFYLSVSNDPAMLQRFSTEAQLAQLVGPNANVAQLYSAWQKLIVQAYNHNINGQNLTPWDILANSIPGVQAGSYKNNNGYTAMQSMTAQQAADIASKAAQKDANKTTQSTQIDINYTDPDTARYVINQASEQLLGRQATNAEVASFTKALNANEAMFPKMTQDTRTSDTGTTSTTTPSGTSEVGGQGQAVVGYDSAGNPIYGPTGSTTSTNTTGNTTDTVVSLGEQDYTRYGREQLAQDAAKAAPDYGAYQAAGPLFQAFLGTLKGAVQGVGSNQ